MHDASVGVGDAGRDASRMWGMPDASRSLSPAPVDALRRFRGTRLRLRRGAGRGGHGAGRAMHDVTLGAGEPGLAARCMWGMPGAARPLPVAPIAALCRSRAAPTASAGDPPPAPLQM